MRVRRLSAVFWAMCVAACIFILYVVMDLGFNLPSIKPPIQELDESKWASFESKLQQIESDLNKHHAVVGEIKSVVDQLDRFQGIETPQHKPKEQVKDEGQREAKVVGDEPPRLKPPVETTKQRKPFDTSVCPIMKTGVPKTDIQMLSMYERIMFDDKDGGAWKQGWNIEYNEKQWSSRNKLKVFIVPHSHNDPGWLKTFENYYKTQTQAIFTNMVTKLFEGEGRKFIWAEISFLSLWWKSDATPQQKDRFMELLNRGSIEIVTGGWVMNDEANSHWLSVMQQLTTGHQWLMENLGYTPKNAWAIDPFGHSSSQPYLLKLAGLNNSVIQRVHYRVKKELALSRQLEFKWRQLWDGVGKTDMLTHMMPFYSYDVPHTCGPDPKVCCQFDFKRLPGNGVSCPWGTSPIKIIQKNVGERASLILDQWRKKAQLYRSNAVLVPLGDDFRYDRTNEWDNQYRNYESLIDYINNQDSWNAEVQFGTLQDYFKAVHEEVKSGDFPVLSGDFFTYADRNQHYWSGYYTSRPFYKNMDRVLLAYVRAAEIISAQATVSRSVSELLSVQLRDRVHSARTALALFQHHDGVTGTARDDVKEDYANKMLQAIKHCQSAIQQAAYHLLNKPTIQDQSQEDIYFDVDDIWWTSNEIPTRIAVALDVMSPTRRLVFYNALAFQRQEVVTVMVTNVNVEVTDPDGNKIKAQVSPVVTGEKRLGIASNKYQLSFLVTVRPLGLAAYTVSLTDNKAINKYTSYARVRIYNADYWDVKLPPMFVVEQPASRLSDDVTVRAGNNGTRVVATAQGLIKSIVSADGTVTPVHMDFVYYGSQQQHDNNSGAYLFMPEGPARVFTPDPFPELVVCEGPLKATLFAGLVKSGQAEIVLATVDSTDAFVGCVQFDRQTIPPTIDRKTKEISVHNNPSLPQSEVEITNTFQLDPAADDIELAMRFSTSLANGDTFYTDLNGMQMIKRRYFSKLPLQANFYPLPAAAYIEDDKTRFTLLTSTPLGMAALAPGQIEVMQDRRLSRDDNRGLNQGILDNIRTRHRFTIIVEHAAPCERKSPPEHPSGQLSLGAHVAQQTLLQPLVPLHYAPVGPGDHTVYDVTEKSTSLCGVDVVLAAYNSHVHGKSKEGVVTAGAGMTFHRVNLDLCYGNSDVTKFYTPGSGQIPVSEITRIPAQHIFDSSLTFSRIKDNVPDGVVTLCPMEIRSVFLKLDRANASKDEENVI